MPILENTLLLIQNIQGNPTTGGNVKVFGEITLTQNPDIAMQFTVRNIPVSALGKLYRFSPPQSISTAEAKIKIAGKQRDFNNLKFTEKREP